MKKIICVCLSIMMCISCGCVQKKVYSQSQRDYIVYNMESLPDDLLMINSRNIRQQDLISALFEGLVSVDSEGNIIPALASEWTVSKDKLTYTFKIRENARWSDGSKITSKDFVDFFSRILREENNLYAKQLECIFGAKDYADKKIDFDGMAITNKSDDELEIRLNYPCSYFLDIISNPALSLKENFYNLKQWKKEYKKIKYSGPFIIDNIYENGEVCLKKNNSYWNKENVKTSKIHIRNEKNAAFALAGYKYNNIDILTNIPFSEVENINSNEKMVKGFYREGISLNFNLDKNKVTSNSNFRKAVKYAINKEEIANELNTILEKASFYIPSNTKGMNRTEDELDIKKGANDIKELLDNSEYEEENISLVYYSSNDINKKIADHIVKSLKDVGIKIMAKGYSDQELKEIIYNGDYDMLLTNYMGDYDSPYAFLERWISNSSENISQYKNSEFDSYVLRSKVTSDNDEMIKGFKEAEKILLDDVACIPIGFYKTVLCKKAYINGIEINKRGNINLKNIYAEKLK
ncbi:peptide ABC transporter substrate-binding protein [Clostridium sp.]|uniref:peptide ABC transporter substrate-binding protein n=1 Tax=Clostridium sp. TaxID=1506 RepID=UPI0039F5C7C9